MTVEIPGRPLKGSKALIVGIANEHSIAPAIRSSAWRAAYTSTAA